MALTFKNRIYIGFTLAILLSVVSGLTSYIILQKQQKQRVFVRKARSILDTTTSIQNQLIEMEVGRRGFRVTNQKRFLEPYNNGLQHIGIKVAVLKKLLADDPELENIETDLEQHVNAILSFWAKAGDNASDYTREYITNLTDDEKRQMDEIRVIIAKLQKEESKLLTVRRDEYDQLVHFGTLASSIDSVVSLAIIIILIIIIIREFKSRRKVQSELRTTVAQLKDKTDVLQTSEAELKNAIEELGVINKQLEKFVYTVAHDIKSPLSGIIGALYIMRINKAVIESPDLKQFVELSHNAGLHLAKMVDSLLEYSTLSIRQQPAEPVNTKELSDQLSVLLFPPNNIEILVNRNMPTIITRRLKIEQVFQNLLSNAIKYNGKKKGIIEVGCNDKGAYYEFYIRDNGQGIDEKDKDKIFTLLGTSGNKSSADSSTGFGLGIVKLIVEEQGGKIWYDSTKGAGSTFYFEWMK
ncbi:MAG: chemotaxis regulator - transmits chemoreceptor signals to flagelllar motor component cheY [Flavipsychrobacter sp.]|nr:chemotaxis regulator - transmits chemoreceptor signals to flagelllar motor component cheY [Flavipsychrobacter sp.]